MHYVKVLITLLFEEAGNFGKRATIIGETGKNAKLHSTDTNTLLFLIEAIIAVRTTIPKMMAIEATSCPSIFLSFPKVAYGSFYYSAKQKVISEINRTLSQLQWESELGLNSGEAQCGILRSLHPQGNSPIMGETFIDNQRRGHLWARRTGSVCFWVVWWRG